MSSEVKNGGNILETSNYWRIYFINRKHLDAGYYYMCKQLYNKWVVNTARKTLDTNSGVKPYVMVLYFYRIGNFGDCFNDN